MPTSGKLGVPEGRRKNTERNKLYFEVAMLNQGKEKGQVIY